MPFHSRSAYNLFFSFFLIFLPHPIFMFIMKIKNRVFMRKPVFDVKTVSHFTSSFVGIIHYPLFIFNIKIKMTMIKTVLDVKNVYRTTEQQLKQNSFHYRWFLENTQKIQIKRADRMQFVENWKTQQEICASLFREYAKYSSNIWQIVRLSP